MLCGLNTGLVIELLVSWFDGFQVFFTARSVVARTHLVGFVRRCS